MPTGGAPSGAVDGAEGVSIEVSLMGSLHERVTEGPFLPNGCSPERAWPIPLAGVPSERKETAKRAPRGDRRQEPMAARGPAPAGGGVARLHRDQRREGCAHRRQCPPRDRRVDRGAPTAPDAGRGRLGRPRRADPPPEPAAPLLLPA